MPTVYITAPTAAADELAETLVEDRLAACVNRLSTTSTYRWDGEIQRDEEAVLLAKTTAEVYDDLVTRVREEHPYDVPCIERFDEDDVFEPFAEWRAESVANR
ncbi:divalent-cation tolerance protein CutA [Natrinema salsiterrestre]|uniref:Divalent-cation tolerance protein CutA n=1 Tax=Natrinema salsiterrestre TaxID=2950540 RepID=A0A9Q4L7D2_9EURY|nr:divalent-cation tolerance protein CutA [Natrinema salsiterrestre]MDF9746606.1 divalent-cation tolerance protein CutA [Natrinema salsiterrestre]